MWYQEVLMLIASVLRSKVKCYVFKNTMTILTGRWGRNTQFIFSYITEDIRKKMLILEALNQKYPLNMFHVFKIWFGALDCIVFNTKRSFVFPAVLTVVTVPLSMRTTLLVRWFISLRMNNPWTLSFVPRCTLFTVMAIIVNWNQFLERNDYNLQWKF